MNGRSVFETSEFEHWASLSGLQPAETRLIEHFLKPDSRTLEAGTGGGRILLALDASGFSHLSGFDFVPELIARARQKPANHDIDFQVMSADSLDYPDATFDQIIYLQQFLSLFDDPAAPR